MTKVIVWNRVRVLIGPGPFGGHHLDESSCPPRFPVEMLE